jgi:hypothetical protein
MGVENLLFHIDTIVVDGAPIAFEDGSGMISGAARYQNEVVPSASGDDFNKRKRVPTFFKCKIQFNNAVDPKIYVGMQGVQIAARDRQSGRRALMNNCSFGDMGDLGGGAVDVTFNVLSEIQWL